MRTFAEGTLNVVGGTVTGFGKYYSWKTNTSKDNFLETGWRLSGCFYTQVGINMAECEPQRPTLRNPGTQEGVNYCTSLLNSNLRGDSADSL